MPLIIVNRNGQQCIVCRPRLPTIGRAYKHAARARYLRLPFVKTRQFIPVIPTE